MWTSLVNQAGLDIKRYDSGIETRLRQYLQFPDEANLTVLLKNNDVSPEALLAGFFYALQPFTEMYSDILKLIEAIGLQAGKENLLVQFDFDEGKTQFKLDLDNFRTQFEQWRRALRSIVIEHWNYDRIWLLARTLGYQEQISQPVYEWAETYDAGFWAENDLDSPVTGNEILDNYLRHAWSVRQVLINAAKQVSPRWEDLRRIDSLNSREGLTIVDGKIEQTDDVLGFVRMVHSDHWAKTVTISAYAQAQKARNDFSYGQELANKLKEVLENPLPEKREIEDMILEIEKLLQLPIWKHRYELYSIWVLTQIIDALGGAARFTFFLEEDVFHIPFSAKRLAALEDVEPPVYICSEVRYPLTKPRGKSRKQGMQPDYSMTTDDSEPPKKAFALIECKQYLKQARRSFGDAITDYATGQPNAHVMLVNYGPATQEIKKYVPTEFHNRAEIIGYLHPTKSENISEFHLMLRKLVENNSQPKIAEKPEAENLNGKEYKGDKLPADPELEQRVRIEILNIEQARQLAYAKMIICLCWKNHPSDLDLYAYIPNNNQYQKVYFSDKGVGYEFPYAEFKSDVRSGFGPEKIFITKTVPGLYKFFVHVYLDDSPLAGSEATVIFGEGSQVRVFVCPDEGEGRWWHVFDFDSQSNEIFPHNKLQISSPPE